MELTRKEHELLLYLMSNRNRVITKESIADFLWGEYGGGYGSYDFVYTHLKNLRRKLVDAGCPDYIKNMYGVGYKFSLTGMKLLTKTTLYIATLSLFLFFIMGIIFFQVLKNMSLSDLNRELKGIKEVVDDIFPHFLGGQLKGYQELIQSPSNRHLRFWNLRIEFGDTLMFDAGTNQFRTFRYLKFYAEHGGELYPVKLFKSTTPADKLVEQVTLMMTMMVILFLAGIFFLNRFIFRQSVEGFF